MGNSTTYEVKTVYSVEDKGSHSLNALTSRMKAASHEADFLSRHIAGIGAGLAGMFGLEKAKKVFIDFNAEVEQMKIGMSAMIQMNLGGTFAQAQQQAEGLFTEFQNFSKSVPMTTKEVAEFGATIEAMTFAAGGNLKDFTQMAEMGSVAAKSLGFSPEMAGIQISEMLSGNVRRTERFAMAILASSGVSEEKFRAMSGKDRLGVLEKSFSSPAMQAAKEKMQNSFLGVMTTLEDNLQITLGRVGVPLFKAITAEIQNWNKWIESHPKEIEAFMKSASDALVTAFKDIRAVFGFIIEHKAEIMALAQVWMASKMVGMGGGGMGGRLLGGAASGLGLSSLHSFTEGGNWQKVNMGIDGLTAGLAQLPGPLGDVSKALFGIHQAAEAFADYMGAKYDERNRRTLMKYGGDFEYNRMNEFDKSSGKNRRDLAFHFLKVAAQEQALTATASGNVILDQGKLRGALQSGGMADINATAFSQRTSMAHDLMQQDFTFRIEVLKMLEELTHKADPSKDSMDMAAAKHVDSKVTANIKIDVTTNDPDRFVLGVNDIIEDAIRNPGSSRHAPRGM